MKAALAEVQRREDTGERREETVDPLVTFGGPKCCWWKGFSCCSSVPFWSLGHLMTRHSVAQSHTRRETLSTLCQVKFNDENTHPVANAMQLGIKGHLCTGPSVQLLLLWLLLHIRHRLQCYFQQPVTTVAMNFFD